MPSFSRHGAEIHYERAGAGIPLLLLAGLASDGASWMPILEPLQDQFDIIRIDNRGSGQTRDEGGPIDPKNWVDDAIGLMNHLDIEHFCVLGHSLGGMLALRVAAKVPDRVAALITMAAGARTPRKSEVLVRDLETLASIGIDEALWYRLFFQFLFAPAFFENEDNLRAATDASIAYPFRQSRTDFSRQVAAVNAIGEIDLSGIDLPVLSISGDRDLLVPEDHIEQTLSGLPHLTTLTIADAGHSVHWDQPDAVVRAISLFLSEGD